MNNAKALNEVLEKFRKKGNSEREKGTYFENLVFSFLENDATYSPQFSKIYAYTDWAKNQGKDGRDIGIDLVAKNTDNSFTAIQCKFYKPSAKIDKKGVDSFIAASSNMAFNRKIFVDTTNNGLTDNLTNTLESAVVNRITIDDLENSSINWENYLSDNSITQIDKKTLRPHQEEALKGVENGLKKVDRGKLIMACGSGKTFTALKIAEKLAGKNKSVLFLVPSLALMSQTIREWTQDAEIDLHTFSVCSDAQVGKRKVNEDDTAEISAFDLAYPATTNATTLADKIKTNQKDKMTVVFATYQSIEVVSKAQSEHKLVEFDLIICDEAHRTSGATLKGLEVSNFNKIHSQKYIQGKKRLYMTATPRVYIEKIQTVAKDKEALLYSMDDENIYGKELYVLNFGNAVSKGLLSDYKVIILALDEDKVATDIQKRLADDKNELTLDSVVKIIGSYKALAKIGIENTEGKHPMSKAIAFCKSIKLSKVFKNEFTQVVKEHLESVVKDENTTEKNRLSCEVKHVDGKMNTNQRNTGLSWLKNVSAENKCHILSNVRCLSEGVDVPSLDAILFIHSRKSKIDIVQSVGRVMRKAKGKKLGYIILPIGIPSGVNENEVLKGKNYDVVWDVLNALRSHDERLDADINQAEFGQLPNKIEIISEVAKLPNAPDKDKLKVGTKGKSGDSKNKGGTKTEIDYEYDTVQKAILAKIVDKCGTKTYFEKWAKDIAEIAQKHIIRINAIIKNKNSEAYKAFDGFLKQLQVNINNSITPDEVVEMLSQHIITKPVFDALFENHNFTEHNPISIAMQKVINELDKNSVDKEAKALENFYISVQNRVKGINTAQGKQAIIIELYDTFFKEAFPKMAERLGIVYTPVECVDFIIHSVNDVLKQEFNQSIGDKGTHIIDPFTGTGTFITRLLQSNLIPQEKLEYKFKNELHANEIVLLAYYIASINIEAVYNALVNENNKNDKNNTNITENQYQSFEGICLTDTFQLYEEKEDLITPLLPVNSKRLNKQKDLDIKVIMGNPPYSIGQSSANDDNQNVEYPKLDASIESSYAKNSTAGLSKGLYDSYIRAIRWASDRIGNTGVIGFITNAGWIEKGMTDGLRQSLQKEFSNIYIFHLRGSIRGKSKELAKKEGQNVFDIMTGVAISILVKNPTAKTTGNIYFHDIGDYLNREDKLKTIREFGSINSITEQKKWKKIEPDKYNDWINQRDDSFYNHIVMGDKKSKKKDKQSVNVFENYSLGVATNRDAWVYNFSKDKLKTNVVKMIDFYNQSLDGYKQALENNNNLMADNFIDNDKTKIAWTVNIKKDLTNGKSTQFIKANITQSLYRPFTKQQCYFNRQWNERVLQMPQIFPEAGLDNIVIGVSGKGSRTGFDVLISNILPDLNFLTAGGQCFPLKLYEPVSGEDDKGQGDMFFDENIVIVEADSGQKYQVRDGITDEGLKDFTDFYKTKGINKEDLFYYIYGLLHSEDYKKRFNNNLVKDLPRIPKVKKLADFKKFSTAGRGLADLHLNYENKDQYEVNYKDGNMAFKMLQDKDFYVEKMKFAGKDDKSSIIYNHNITITDIPLEAYDYRVNGKSAIEWVMDRQRIATHKDSQITNNPNDWAKENNNSKYPLELLLKVITISIDTVSIVEELPKLDF